MGRKEPQQKLSFNLVCRYYAFPQEVQQCLGSLEKYLELEKHQKRLSGWDLLATEFSVNEQGLPEKTVRIVLFGVRFTHKWMTLVNLGLARHTFSETVHTIKGIMGGLAKASCEERGILDWSKMFSYGCNPCIGGELKKGWGIEAVGYYCHPREQAGPNGSAQKAIQELLINYMEMPSTLRGMKMSSSSSYRALDEACRRVKSADDNTRPLWSALYCTSVFNYEPLQLDIDLVVFTIKKVVCWYDELLALFKVTVQFEDVVSRVNKAADLGESLSPVLNKKKAEVDTTSVTSGSDKTLCGEEDWVSEKATVIEIEDADKPGGRGVSNQHRPRRNWWRAVLRSIGINVRGSKREPHQTVAAGMLRERSLEIKSAHAELSDSVVEFAAEVKQLRVLAKGFVLLTKLQTQWEQVYAMAKKPGVDMAETNKVTMVNIMELSCYTWRAKKLDDWAGKVKRADNAMMQNAASIVQRSKKLQTDLDGFFEEHRRFRDRYAGFGACHKCVA